MALMAGAMPFAALGMMAKKGAAKKVRTIPEYDYLSALARFGSEEAEKQEDRYVREILREEAIMTKLLAEATKGWLAVRSSERLRKLAALGRQVSTERGTLSLAGRYFAGNAGVHERLAAWCEKEENREDAPKEPSPPDPPIDAKNQLHCTFCGKGQLEVTTIVAGPSVYICDECIGLCGEILEERAAKAAKPPRRARPPTPPPPTIAGGDCLRYSDTDTPQADASQAQKRRVGDILYYTLGLSDERRTPEEKRDGKRGIRAAMVVRVDGEKAWLRIFSEYGPYETVTADAVYAVKAGEVDRSWSWREQDAWKGAGK